MRRILIWLSLSLALFTGEISSQTQSGGPDDQSGRTTLNAKASCSKAKPGTAIAELVLNTMRQEASRYLDVATVRVDVTTVRNGFDSGLSLAIWPSKADLETKSSDHRIDPIKPLRIVPSSTTAQDRNVGSPTTRFTVENLQPGVNYFWRLEVPTPQGTHKTNIVMTTGPVCPIDWKR